MSRKRLSKKVKKELVENVLNFIDKINLNMWNIDPGMATSDDLLRELKKRDYKVPEDYKMHLGRILIKSGQFEGISKRDRRLSDKNSIRVFYKKK